MTNQYRPQETARWLGENMLLYKTLFDSADDAILLLKDNHIIECNPRTLSMLKCKREEILHKKPEVFSPMLQPDGRRSSRKVSEKSQAALQGEPQIFEWRSQCLDGTQFDAEVSLARIELRGEFFIQAIVRDVTDRKRAEEAIREAEKKYREVVENAADIIYTTDKDGRFTFANAAGLKSAGYTLEELCQHHFLRFVLPEHRKRVKELYEQQLLSRQRTTYIEFPFFTKEGEVKWYGQNASLTFRAKNVTGFHIIARDITERKHAEEAQRESEEQFRSLVETSMDAVLLMTTDGVILAANTAACSMFKRSKEDLKRIGRSGVVNVTDPRLQALLEERTRTGSARSELTFVRSDGTMFPAEISSAVFQTQAGQSCTSMVIRDITERMQAERELRRSEARYRAVLNSAADAIVTADRNGTIVGWNNGAERMFGYRYTEAAGQPLTCLMPQRHRARHTDGFNRVLSGGEPLIMGRTIEMEGLRKDGSEFPLELSLSEWDIEEGRFYTGIIRDITRRTQAEESSRESERRHRSLFENMLSGYAYCKILLEGDIPQDFIYVDVNPAFERLTGMKNVVGKRVTELIPGIKELNPELFEIYGRVALGGESERFETYVGALGIWFSIAVYSPRKEYFVAVFDNVTERKQAEESLAAERNLLRTLIDNLPDRIYVKDNSCQFLINNIAHLKALGVESAADAIGKSDLDFRPFGIAARSQADDLRVIQSGTPLYNKEEETTLPNGEPGWLLTSKVPLQDRQGNVAGLVGISRDITQQRISEEDVRKDQQWLRAMFTASIDGIVVESEEMIVFANDAFARLYGYESAQELTGEHVSIVQSPEDSKQMLEYGARRLRGERAPSRYELDGKRKDGSTVRVEASVSTAIVHDKQYIITVVRDITGRKEVEEKLRQLSLAVEQSPVSIVITDTKGGIEYVNTKFSEVSGYTFEEIKGRNPRILKSDETSAGEYKHLWDEITSGHEWRGVFHNRKKNGELYWESASISPITDEDGKTTHFLAVKEDITKHKALEDQFRQAQKLESIGTLAGGIAHDFNNILGIILGHVSLLQRGGNKPERFASSLGSIQSAVNRGANLVRQILTFARKTDIVVEPISANDIIEELAKMMEETFPKMITVSTSLDPAIPAIEADRTQFHQTILNLCVNARDAMPNGGTLSIATDAIDGANMRARFPDATKGGYVHISVADNGMGMDDAIKAKIFEPFFTTKEMGKGTGLGLAVVHGIIKSHNGFINVVSAPGEGTTFHLFFPVIEQQIDAGIAGPVQEEEVPGGTETILVVEDEEDLCNLLTVMLDSKGYSVIRVGDGEEAVRVYGENRNKIDLVISDIGLPKLDGARAFHSIKEINPSVKVILASGYLEPIAKAQLLHDGVKAFIGKPYASGDVLSTIRRVLGQI